MPPVCQCDSSLIVVGSGHRLHVANLKFIVNLSAEEINLAQTETPRGSEQKKKIKSQFDTTFFFWLRTEWVWPLNPHAMIPSAQMTWVFHWHLHSMLWKAITRRRVETNN